MLLPKWAVAIQVRLIIVKRECRPRIGRSNFSRDVRSEILRCLNVRVIVSETASNDPLPMVFASWVVT